MAKASDPSQTFVELQRQYPDAHCALHHKNAYQLLVATILSAQCTDERVNQVTPVLFKRYKNALDLAKAKIEDVAEIIHSTGFYHNKSKNLILCATALVERHKGEVPRDIAALTALAGVGRKTANVVLGNAFGIASGIVVDTHVGRLAFRLGWTRQDQPDKIESDLTKIFDSTHWVILSHLLISHGRAVCKARRPLCESCFLFDRCPKRGVK